MNQLIKDQMGKRVAMVMVGTVIMAFSVALLKMLYLGTDPYSAMMLSLTKLTPLSYGTFCLIGNCVFFAVEFLFGRKYIGFGTLVNWFVLGYFVDFWLWVFDKCGIVVSQQLGIRIVLCVLMVVVLGFSLSVYQTADAGSSPYDSMPLIIRDKTVIPFFAARVLLDGSAALVAFLTGGVIGLATILIFIGCGPIAAFFNKNFSEKLLEG